MIRCFRYKKALQGKPGFRQDPSIKANPECSSQWKVTYVNGYAKKMRYGIETTSPQVAKVCFKHNNLRQFCDFEKDIKIEEIMFVYANKERG